MCFYQLQVLFFLVRRSFLWLLGAPYRFPFEATPQSSESRHGRLLPSACTAPST